MSVAVVTGASGGIGRWIALGLARAGRHVVLVGRNEERLRAAEHWVRSAAPDASTETALADLSSLRAADLLGRHLADRHGRVGVLVNNAGIFARQRRLTAEGHDAVLATNHLAPAVLADALESALRAGAPSRIVNVGSSAADRARIDPDDLELDRRWSMVRAYAQSKLALLMSSFARAERLKGSGVVVNVVHPGLVATGLVREPGAIGLAWRLLARVARTEEEGAAPPLLAALSPDWAAVSGAYLKNRARAVPNRRALDAVLVARVDAATRALIARTLDRAA